MTHDINFKAMTLDQLETLFTEVKKEIKAKKRAAWEKEKGRAWAWVRNVKHGDSLFVHANSTYLKRGFWGLPIRHGDEVIVHVLQPRKKILWIIVKGKYYGLSPALVARYQLRPDPPKSK